MKKIMTDIDRKILIRNGGAVISLFLIYIFIEIIKDRFLEEYTLINNSCHYIEDLKSNVNRLLFVKKHSFSKTTEVNFTENLNQFCSQNHIVINDISELKSEKQNGISVISIEINLEFWHDMIFFKFLDFLYEFSPGFIQVVNFSTEKISDVNFSKPSIGAIVSCKIFSNY